MSTEQAEGMRVARDSAEAQRVTGAIERLSSVRARARLALVLEALLWIGAVVLGAVLAAGVIDYLLRLPGWLRLAMLLLGAAGTGWLVFKRVRPAAGFAPTLSELAAWIEGHLGIGRGALASAVDFSGGDAQQDAMSRLALARLAESLDPARLRGIVDWSRVRRRLLNASGIAVVGAGIFMLSPALFGIGAQRVLLPWTDATWPKRTEVRDAMGIEVHPLGRSLALRAELVRSSRSIDATDVAVRTRVIRGGEMVRERRELMTAQSTPLAGGGAVFERLIDPSGDALEYRFETEDDATEWRRVRLIEPPRIVSARATLTPPSYLEDADPARVDLGDGTDRRAVAPPSLQGSAVTLEIELNTDDAQLFSADESDGPIALGAMLAERDGSASVDIDGRTVRASFTLDSSLRLALIGRDAHGIEGDEPAIFRFEAREDAEPSVTIVEPASDRSVLATALVDVRAEARDDVRLMEMTIERTVLTPEGGSGAGGSLTPRGEPMAIARVVVEDRLQAEARAAVDLRELGVAAGDVVRLVAFALDQRPSEAARSVERRLRIVDRSQYIDLVRRDLAGIRERVIRLDEAQRELAERMQQEGAGRAVRRAQAEVTRGVRAEVERLEELAGELRANRLGEPSLSELIDRAAEQADRAGEASARASTTLDDAKARAGDEEPPELTDEERARVDASQEEVRDRLGALAELLDRGDDAWAARNAVERVLEAQKELRERTERAGAETAGQSRDELSDEQRAELDEIAAEQQELAQRGAELAEELREAQRRLRESDPATAAAAATAAARAEQARLDERMEAAAELAQENQTASASQQQQEAIEALEEVLEDLDEAEQQRDEVLRRLLAELMDTLRQLIEQQRAHLGEVKQADPGGLGALGASLIRLHQNTLGAVDQAAAGGPEAAATRALVERAADAQERAIPPLRDLVPDRAAAVDLETLALELLERALEEAQQADDDAAQREAERARRELRAAYREALTLQTALIEDAEPFAEAERLNRRDRLRVRAFADNQRAIGGALDAILEQTEDVQDAAVFDFAHRRLNRFVERAADAFAEPDAHRGVEEARGVARGIASLLEALEDPEQDQDFESQQGGGGGGGSGGGMPGQDKLVPPLAELRLLRFVQEDVATRTTQLGNANDEDDRNEVRSIADDQRALAELARAVVESLQQQDSGPIDPQIQEQKP